MAPPPKRVPIPTGLRIARDRARQILDDPLYFKQLKDRALAGMLPPMLEVMLHQYAYGKPIERIEVLDDNNSREDFGAMSVDQLKERIEVLRLAAISVEQPIIDVEPEPEPAWPEPTWPDEPTESLENAS